MVSNEMKGVDLLHTCLDFLLIGYACLFAHLLICLFASAFSLVTLKLHSMHSYATTITHTGVFFLYRAYTGHAKIRTWYQVHFYFCMAFSMLYYNPYIQNIQIKNHIIRTRLMYHAACKLEFQPFKRLYSQLTFFTKL